MLQRSIELSSMGIRVDKEALLRQLKEEGEEKRLELYFHKRFLNYLLHKFFSHELVLRTLYLLSEQKTVGSHIIRRLLKRLMRCRTIFRN